MEIINATTGQSSVRNPLDDDQLREQCPAIFAERPANTVSGKYSFFPTIELVNHFRTLDWYPVKTQYDHMKEGKEYATHLVRFAKKDSLFQPGEVIPEILLENSHNGYTRFNIKLGMFRVLCSNGLVTDSSVFEEARVKHMNVNFEYIHQLTDESTRQFEIVLNKIDEYKNITLSEEEKNSFGKKAIDFCWGENSVITPDQILVPRREGDAKDDLFSVYNVVQENITKGGLTYTRVVDEENNRVRNVRTREIRGIWNDMRINQGLWMMMAAFAVNKNF